GLTVFAAWLVIMLVKPWPAQYPWRFLGNEYHFRFFAGMLVAEVTHRWRIPRPRLVALAGLTLFLTTGFASVYTELLRLPVRSAGYTLGSALLIAGLVSWEKTAAVRVPQL